MAEDAREVGSKANACGVAGAGSSNGEGKSGLERKLVRKLGMLSALWESLVVFGWAGLDWANGGVCRYLYHGGCGLVFSL
jgi:hypothetical protein